jgi:hypothetical protein
MPGAIVIDRTVLEWRLDPASPDRIPEADSYDRQIILVCRQGYSSSSAAASLRAIGPTGATDSWTGSRANPPQDYRCTLGPLRSGDEPGNPLTSASPKGRQLTEPEYPL